MQVRTVNVSDADGRSAELFFDALTGFYDLSKARALDMFARTGQQTVSKYAPSIAIKPCGATRTRNLGCLLTA